jgi:hypothetical protein
MAWQWKTTIVNTEAILRDLSDNEEENEASAYPSNASSVESSDTNDTSSFSSDFSSGFPRQYRFGSDSTVDSEASSNWSESDWMQVQPEVRQTLSIIQLITRVGLIGMRRLWVIETIVRINLSALLTMIACTHITGYAFLSRQKYFSNNSSIKKD